jgi:hypothetical protein
MIIYLINNGNDMNEKEEEEVYFICSEKLILSSRKKMSKLRGKSDERKRKKLLQFQNLSFLRMNKAQKIITFTIQNLFLK